MVNPESDIRINGVDVRSYAKRWEINQTIGDAIDDCMITFRATVADALTITAGQTLTIKRGPTGTENFEFDGRVSSVEEAWPMIKVRGQNRIADLKDAEVTKTYNGLEFPSTEAKGSDIMTDLIVNEAGLTANVTDTGSLLEIKKYVCNHTDVFTRLQELAGIYDYQILWDADNQQVTMEPKAGTTETIVLRFGTGVTNNIVTEPKWMSDDSQLFNDITIQGAEEIKQTEELFNGDGTADQELVLTRGVPITVRVEVDDGSGFVERTPGVEDATTGAYDYEVDKEAKKIKFNQAYDPTSDSGNIRVTYTFPQPVPVRLKNQSSIGLYGTRQKTYQLLDIQTVADAEARGRGILNKYSTPFTFVKNCKFLTDDVFVGRRIRIVDGKNGKDQTLIIQKIKKVWPYNGDFIELGDREWRLEEWGRMTQERIKRLEELQLKNTDLVVSIEDYEYSYQVKPRIVYLQSRGKGDGLVYDDPVNGFYDQGFKYDGTLLVDPVTEIAVWHEATFTESFTSSDLIGDGTATLNTTEGRLE